MFLTFYILFDFHLEVFTSLKIHKLCNASAPAEGGTEIMLLCEYVFTGRHQFFSALFS